MKARRGWLITWPDGTTWYGDCPRWAAGPLMPGATVTPCRIYGAARWPCSGCLYGGTRH